MSSMSMLAKHASDLATKSLQFSEASDHTGPLRRSSSRSWSSSSIDGDGDEEEEEEAEAYWTTTRSFSEMHGSCSQLVIREDDKIRVTWNIVLAFLLVYTGTIFPYRLCFVELSVSGMEYNDPGWTAVEWAIDGLFYFDLVANFFFSYRDKEGTEVINLRLIAVRYLEGYFALNLIACIPPPLVGWIIQSVSSSNDTASINKSTRLPRLQRISRLARLTRLTRLGKLFTFVMENPVWKWFRSLRGVRVINFLAGLGWAVHLVACGWYLTASLHSEEDQADTWLAQRGLLEAGPLEQWFHAMYFVLTVFTTVGFGDMSANTMGEIAYVCFTMLVGAVVHSIIMSEVINIVMQVDQAALDLNSQKELVMGFARHVELQGPVLKDLFRFFDQQRGRRTHFDRDRMRALLTNCAMPRDLMGDLIRGAFDGCLENNKLITTCLRYEKRMPPRFPLLVALSLNSRIFKARELVYSAYDHPWNVFLVTSGTFANIAFPSKQGGVAELPPECIDLPKPQASGVLETDRAISRKSTGIGFGARSISAASAARSSISARFSLREAKVPSTPTTPTEARRNPEMGRRNVPVLYPYQLFGYGTYFGEAELLLEPGRSRFSSARCESDPCGGTVLVLHATDLQKLCNDFPRFAVAWRTSSRRREERRRKCLKRLKLGHTYESFSATIIQRHARRLLLKKDEISPPSPRLKALNHLNSIPWQRHSFLSGEPSQVTVAHLNALRVDMLKALNTLSEDISSALGRELPSASTKSRRPQLRHSNSTPDLGQLAPKEKDPLAEQELFEWQDSQGGTNSTNPSGPAQASASERLRRVSFRTRVHPSEEAGQDTERCADSDVDPPVPADIQAEEESKPLMVTL